MMARRLGQSISKTAALWLDPTDELLYLKLLKKLMLVLMERCHRSLLRMGLHSCRPVRVLMLTPCPLPKAPTVGT